MLFSQNPLLSKDWIKLAVAQQNMMLQASEIIVRRTMLMGSGAMSSAEATGMIAEKPAAFVQAWEKAITATMTGAAPLAIANAALAPIGSKTRANARRLRKG